MIKRCQFNKQRQFVNGNVFSTHNSFAKHIRPQMKNARDKNAGTDENRLGLRAPTQTKNVQS